MFIEYVCQILRLLPVQCKASSGLADDQSKSTGRIVDPVLFVDPPRRLTYQTGNNPVPDYFEGTKGDPITSAYGRYS